MIARILLSVLILYISVSYGQDQQIDSLLHITQTSRNTDQIIEAYIALGNVYQKADLAISDNYFQLGLELAKKEGGALLTATLLSDFGWNRYLKSEYSQALAYFDSSEMQLSAFSSLPSAEKNSKEEVLLLQAKNLRNIGVVHDARSNYPEALKNYFNALRIYDGIKNAKGMAKVYGSIGISYTDTRDFNLALANFQKSIAINDSLGNPNDNRSNFINLGNLFYAFDKVDQALLYYKRAAAINEALGDGRSMSIVLGNMATIFSERGQLDSALEYHRMASSFGAKLGNVRVEALHLTNIGKIYLKKGQTDIAEKHFRESLSLATKIGAVDLIRDVHLELSSLLDKKGNYKEALAHLRDYNRYRDSIASDESRKELMRQQLQYDYEKREVIIKAQQEKREAIAREELKRKNQQRNAFIGGFVLMLGLAGISYRSYRIKKRDNSIITKEKARSESLLLNILPRDVADELKAYGKAEARLIDNVTVLFTDFKGFTKLSEQLSPTALVSEINECFSEFDAIIQKHGIEKIKTIGDAYMAAGGVPAPNQTHAMDVVMAALEIQQYMKLYQESKLAAGSLFFELRIGIHTGPVVAGIVGVNKFQYDIWGDTVNIASRMESSGEAGRINISQTTRNLIHTKIDCEYRGEIDAKGKGKMGMYFVIDSKLV
jgi:class 3 adenylate cyclase/Tfp pilus assembly protein PilF